MIIIGVDTGGTFTDLMARHRDSLFVLKVLSTPDDPSRAVLQGLAKLLEESGLSADQVVHGSTVATNAILERKGVRTALVTTYGFEDVPVIGRQNRSRLYDLSYRREPPLAPEELRLGVRGRIGADGSEIEPLDEDGARKAAQALIRAGAQSVAVCLLFSFARPEHELRVREIIRETAQAMGAELSISLSHEILSEFREFERCSTTLVNAYVSPRMERYIAGLDRELAERGVRGLRIMQSNGGSISAATAMREPVRTILSGPAGGVVGALAVGRRAELDKLITFDMGGTSTDVSLIDHDLSLTTESMIGSHPVKTPMIDIHTVGAGGGSIADLDQGGALFVGPESAGADPGPICYGKGERITVTDANLFLGRLIPDHFLGGTMRLDRARLEEPFARLARRADLAPAELAEGVLAVANANMERAIRVISVERGFDPREFTLFSFGGAGGLHAMALASLLAIPRVLAPANPGILSAQGMLLADVIRDYSHTVMLRPGQDRAELDAELNALFSPLKERGASDLAAEAVDVDQVVLERFLDMRYQGQSHEIIVPLTGDCVADFHALHKRTYGHADPNKGVEIVNLRLRARGLPARRETRPLPLAGEKPDPAAILGNSRVVFQGRYHEAAVVRREALAPGNRVPGPAVIVEYSSTLFLPPGAEAQVNGFLDLVLTLAPDP